MWFVFALLSALSVAFRKVAEKRLAQDIHYFTFGWALQVFALPVVFLAWLLVGEPVDLSALGPGFWVPMMLIWLGFYPLSGFLYVSALKHGELSKVLPLQSFGPIFALLLVWPLLGQSPSLTVLLGIAIVVLGVYVLNLKGQRLYNPLDIIRGDKANLHMLLNLLLIATAGVLDAIAIKASDPLFFGFVSTLGAIPILLAFAWAFRVKEFNKVRRHFRTMTASGSLFGASYLTQMIALGLGPLAYVTAVRSSSAVIGAVLGFLYLKEVISLPKLVALGLIAAGSIILGLQQ